MFLKIASINFWGLKKPASIDKEIRLKRLIEFIKNENLSIVCLQEIWLKQDLDFIINNLKDYYFAYDLNNKKKNPSGLLIITKFKILKKSFIN
ncbi:MAG: endonuclease/exonuclease/phosphatase family protein, partial [Candidatus Woesearchaeota archaeon]